MTNSSDFTIRRAKPRLGEPGGRLDMDSPATAVAFRVAAKAYTKRATKTKASAVKALHREQILTKDGKFAKPYSLKS